MSARASRPALALLVALGLIAAACGGGGGNGATATAAPGAATPRTVAEVTERITLVRDQRLLVRAPDGAERLLFEAPHSNVFPAFPTWSPDGSRVAFVQSIFAVSEGGDRGDDIYTIDATGGQEPQLVRAHTVAGEEILGMAWTPDGATLLAGVGTPRAVNGRIVGFDYAVDRVDLATGDTTRLVDGAIEPSITRDGTRIAYLVPGTDSDTTLWVAGADASDAHVVALPDSLQPPFGPRISPDGTRIAFSAPTSRAFSARPGGPSDPPWRRLAATLLPFVPGRAEAHGVPMEVWQVEIASDDASPLTNFGEDDPRAAWEPDGSMLIVIGAGGLYRVAVDGSGAERIDDGAFAGQLDVR